jgi:hypothetical protein
MMTVRKADDHGRDPAACQRTAGGATPPFGPAMETGDLGRDTALIDKDALGGIEPRLVRPIALLHLGLPDGPQVLHRSMDAYFARLIAKSQRYASRWLIGKRHATSTLQLLLRRRLRTVTCLPAVADSADGGSEPLAC